MTEPTPGWYPDPADPSGHRYWDGGAWTEHVSAAAAAPAWGQPTGPPAEYGAYTPQTSELTGSGMRRIPELFSDIGRILKKAWWPITAISVVLWVLWLIVVSLISLTMFDLGRLNSALTLLFDSFRQYPDGSYPRAARQQIEDAFSGVIRIDSPVWWVLIGLAILLVSVLVSCVQIAAVTRLGMEAASGRPATFSAGLRSGVTGGWRLFGYGLLLLLLGGAVTAALVGVIVLLSSVPGLAILITFVLSIALAVLAVWLTGRLTPVLAQVNVDRGALGWTWTATRGKFWAVLGRYLLWSVVASVIGQVALTIVMLPFSLITAAALSTPSPATLMWVTGLYLVSLPLTMAVASLTYIGVVPIWRDLTDDPRYRSIDADGRVIHG